jgi:hypothetical protein
VEAAEVSAKGAEIRQAYQDIVNVVNYITNAPADAATGKAAVVADDFVAVAHGRNWPVESTCRAEFDPVQPSAF